MLPIEIISHLSRVLSLTLRLFGNIMGEDLVLAILMVLAGQFLAPLPMMGLAIFTSFVQAFVFTLLAMLYIAGSHSRSALNQSQPTPLLRRGRLNKEEGILKKSKGENFDEKSDVVTILLTLIDGSGHFRRGHGRRRL